MKERKINNYCVYVHTNKINNKVYVGITGRKPEIRWQNGKAYKNNKHFSYSIGKYGWDNFIHEIVASNLTLKEANNFEKILICKLNSNNKSFGYNLTLGGDGILGCKFLKETKEKMSISMKKVIRTEDWKNKITFSNPIVDFCIINDNAFILNRNALYCYDLTTYPSKNITKLETKLKDMVELIKTSDNRIVVVSADSYELMPLIQ
jgi:group I intron endonuclease